MKFALKVILGGNGVAVGVDGGHVTDRTCNSKCTHNTGKFLYKTENSENLVFEILWVFNKILWV